MVERLLRRGLFSKTFSPAHRRTFRERTALSKADAAKPDEVAHALALLDARTGGR